MRIRCEAFMCVFWPDSSRSIAGSVPRVEEGWNVCIMIADIETIAIVYFTLWIRLQVAMVRSIDWSSIFGKTEYRSVWQRLESASICRKNLSFRICKVSITVLQWFRNTAISDAWWREMIVVSTIAVFVSQASVHSCKLCRVFNGSNRGTCHRNTPSWVDLNWTSVQKLGLCFWNLRVDRLPLVITIIGVSCVFWIGREPPGLEFSINIENTLTLQ